MVSPAYSSRIAGYGDSGVAVLGTAFEAMVSVRMLTFDHAREQRFSAYLDNGIGASSSEFVPDFAPNGRNLVPKNQKGHRQKPIAW